MIFRITVIALAIVAAVAPLPPAFIERAYSRTIYPYLQLAVGSVSNLIPVALLDVVAALCIALSIVWVIRALRAEPLATVVRRTVVYVVTIASLVYLLFLASWGLNYRRIPLEARLDYDRRRIDIAAAERLAHLSVERLNAGYASAHRETFRRELVARSLADVQLLFGASRAAVPARPKRSLLQFYFRTAAIDGMTVPVFLEVILNPDLLPVELPTTLAHEQAHIAGYADESEANFLSWLACIRSGDQVAQYSAWLDAYRLSVSVLSRETRRSLPALEAGPRQDLRDVAARYARASPRIRDAARGVYDSYLRANRIEEGIDNYAVVLQLLLGTRFAEGWTPVMR